MIHSLASRLAAGAALAAALLPAPAPAPAVTGPSVAAAPAQDHYASYRPLQEAVVRAERESRVRALYANAAQPARDAALVLFESDRAARTVAWRPSFATLANVQRVLERRGDAVGPDPVDDFLASLDLRTVPGVAAAKAEGRGDAITVHLAPLHEVRVPEELVMGLDWVAPDGRRERARTEPFRDVEFGDGIEMYVRAPLGDAADWRLEPVLQVNGHERNGEGVTVSLFDDPAALRDALQAGGDGARERPLRDLWRDWNHLRDFGVRSSAPASLRERAGHFGLPGCPEWTRHYAWTSFGESGDVAAWAVEPAGEVRGAVVLARDAARDATYAFADEMEARWKRVADDRGWLVVALSVDDDQADLRRFDALLASLRDQGVGPVRVVVSGDAAILLQRRLAALPEGSFERVLVHNSPTVARGVRSDLDAPVLGLAYGQEEDVVVDQHLDGGGAERWWVRRRGPDFLTELELPALLGRWVDGTLE